MLASTVREAARRFGDLTAFVDPDGSSVTYGDLDRRSDAVAAALAARGVGESDRVVLRLPSDSGYVVAYAAIAKLGAVTAGINPRLAPPEQQALVGLADPALVLTDPGELAELLAAGAALVARDGPPPSLPDDPDRPVYSFSPNHQRAGFWPRRMAHETTMHRVDAEQAVGQTVAPIPPTVAVDGIDEAFSVFVATFGGGRSPGDGRTVHLHATDAEGEWLIRFDPEAIVVEVGHAKGDAAVRGPAEDLLLWLWGRRPLDALELFGDRTAADALRTVTSF